VGEVIDTKDESEPAEYRLGFARGVAAGRAEADKWWAERWKGLRDGKYSLMRAPHVNDELDAKAKEVLGER